MRSFDHITTSGLKSDVIFEFSAPVITARAMLARCMLSSCVRLSVCPLVTSRSCTKVAKPRITQITPYDSSGTLVYWHKKSRRLSNKDHPQRGRQIKVGYVQNADFRVRPIYRYISETVQDWDILVMGG